MLKVQTNTQLIMFSYHHLITELSINKVLLIFVSYVLAMLGVLPILGLIHKYTGTYKKGVEKQN